MRHSLCALAVAFALPSAAVVTFQSSLNMV